MFCKINSSQELNQWFDVLSELKLPSDNQWDLGILLFPEGLLKIDYNQQYFLKSYTCISKSLLIMIIPNRYMY